MPSAKVALGGQAGATALRALDQMPHKHPQAANTINTSSFVWYIVEVFPPPYSQHITALSTLDQIGNCFLPEVYSPQSERYCPDEITRVMSQQNSWKNKSTVVEIQFLRAWSCCTGGVHCGLFSLISLDSETHTERAPVRAEREATILSIRYTSTAPCRRVAVLAKAVSIHTPTLI